MRLLHVVALVMGLAKCGRGGPPAHPASTHGGGAHGVETARSAAAEPAAADAGPSAAVLDPVAELWTRAGEGEADDLARLAHREGAAGLVDAARAGMGARLTAVRALAYADGLSALPFLAEVAARDDVEADAALDALATIAARPRTAVDPEDAAETREGCDAVLALARDTTRPRGRRVGAIRFLRMMLDRGCARPSDVPSDVDVATPAAASSAAPRPP